MRAFARPGLAALMALLVFASASSIHAQAPPTAKDAAATGKAASPARPTAADLALLKETLATVNGEPITRRDLLEFLSQYNLPPDDRNMIYRDAIDTLINTRLVSQFLTRLRIPVSAEKVNEAVATLEKQLKADGTSLAQTLLESNKSLDEVKKIYADRLRWIEYVNQRGTDNELKRFVANHKDLLYGTQVRPSHILLRVDAKATPAEKEKVRQKLLGIKRDIDAKKYTFAEAANKFSEDPANSEGHGGDIGYIGLASGIVEEFAKAAFALKAGQISDPVETPYGYHLITVSDRKEGSPIDFEQNRPLIRNQYAAELQKNLLIEQRKTAKIDIKPMPANLFPPVAPPETTTTPAQSKDAKPLQK